MDKHGLIRALIASLEEDIARAIESAERTRAGAVHDEARPENDKDTRALEASYLARGQAQRVADLQVALKQVVFMEVRSFGPDDAIALSALVQLESLESEDETRWYLLACAGGGRRIAHEGSHADVLTPEAPLGRALAGRHRGEELVLRIGGRVRELSIVAVR
jgi:transcription elongation GreA/GreB family factor